MAGFSANPTSGTAPLVVQFTDESTGEITDWAWDFDNDGTVDSTQQNSSYTYETAGSYTVSLKATDPGGSDTETKIDYITVSPGILTITNQAVDLSGLTIYESEEKLADPRAGSPEYVYLVIGEAVRLDSPQISSDGVDIEGLFSLDNEEIKLYEYGAVVYEVIVNSRLSYRIAIDDFEGEVDLAQVELTKEGSTIKSSFIFAATGEGEGVAHDLIITALVDGIVIASSSPISVEARSS